MNKKLAILLCIVGGVLMILSSMLGSISLFETMYTYIKTEVGVNTARVLFFVIQILAIIAMGGGISVIVGTLIAAMDKIRIGRFIIGIGAGMGLIGLIFLFLTGFIQGTINEQINGIILGIINGSYGFLGVVIIIFGNRGFKD